MSQLQMYYNASHKMTLKMFSDFIKKLEMERIKMIEQYEMTNDENLKLEIDKLERLIDRQMDILIEM